MIRPKTPSKLVQALLACLLALAGSWARADDVTAYQVEIILFKNTGSGAVTSETWPQNPGAPDLSHVVNLIGENGVPQSGAAADDGPAPADAQPPATNPSAAAAPNVPTAYQLLPAKDLQLNGVEASLRRSAVRVPILHLGWRQPIVAKDQAIPIHIFGGTRYTVAPSAAADQEQAGTGGDTDQSATAAQDGQSPTDQPTAPLAPGLTTGTQNTATQPPPVWEIDGTILLSRARYLHVWTDLVFSEPANQVPGAAPDSTDTTLARFRMQQHRRMRSGELHYLDHPLFGMLILVTPYTGPLPPAPSPATTAPAATPTPTSATPTTDTTASPASSTTPGPDQPTPAVATPLPADGGPQTQ